MAEIRYTFTASGAGDVAKTFENIGDAAERSSAKVQKGFAAQAMAKKSADARGRGTKTTINTHQRNKLIDAKRNLKAAKAAEVAATRTAKTEAAKRVRIAEKEASDKARAAERGAKKAAAAEERAQRRVRSGRRRMVGRGFSLAGEAGLRATGALMAGATALVGAGVRRNIAL